MEPEHSPKETNPIGCRYAKKRSTCQWHSNRRVAGHPRSGSARLGRARDEWNHRNPPIGYRYAKFRAICQWQLYRRVGQTRLGRATAHHQGEATPRKEPRNTRNTRKWEGSRGIHQRTPPDWIKVCQKTRQLPMAVRLADRWGSRKGAKAQSKKRRSVEPRMNTDQTRMRRRIHANFQSKNKFLAAWRLCVRSSFVNACEEIPIFITIISVNLCQSAVNLLCSPDS